MLFEINFCYYIEKSVYLKRERGGWGKEACVMKHSEHLVIANYLVFITSR